VELLTLGELYTQLVSWEQQMNLIHGDNSSSSSTNVATHSGRGGFNCGGGGHGHGGRGHGHRNNGGNGGHPQ